MRALLYKAMVFRYLDNNKTILIPDISSDDDLIHRVRLTILRRILDNVADDEIDTALLSDLLYGDIYHGNDVGLLVAEYHQRDRGA